MANLLHNDWKPSEEDGELKPTQRLIHRTYQMMASRSQVISPMYAEILGVPAATEGIESVARHGMINCFLNAPRIAEIYAIGGRPMFKNVRDSVRLYTDVCDYLLAFKKAFESDVIRIDSNENMMTNILKLENLAEWVYSIAAPYMNKEDIITANSLAGRIGRGRFTRGLFAKKDPVKEAIANPNIVVVTHADAEDAPIHGRITDTVMEQHFNSKQVSKRSSGWN